MIFTHAEIEVLRLSAWCKDLPIGSTEIFPQDTIKLLCKMGLIRESRCGLSYRTTQEGYKVLQKGSFDYVPDKQYRGRGSVLTRRLETAEITGFFWRCGADVFCGTPDTEKSRLTFLPSFALRRKSYANVLGGTRLTGFLYSGDTAFIPYYITPESEGIYANVERRTFRAESILCDRSPFVLYTGADELGQLIETVTAKRYKKEKSTTDDYLTALDKFGCPIALMPLNESGMRQLRILSIPSYKEKLIRQILGNDYLPPGAAWSDGWSKTIKEDFLIGIDCNITRFVKAIIQTGARIHIVLLSTQAPAVQNYLRGQNVFLHPIQEENAEQILGISHELPPLNNAPFQTGKGEYLYGTPFREDKKTGRKNGSRLEES